ncbi:hypothetical protein [Myroides odoratus]|uniref:hypothetical protein n=1 Tax=Myroides odoratus TaxID=256 RepID=UPI000765EB51|nr:hypothetical protein [Myroides odoratus]
MKYVIMNEELAIEKEVIPADHYFLQKEGEVIFKKDMLTIYSQKGNQIDFEYEELETAQALNIIDSWN